MVVRCLPLALAATMLCACATSSSAAPTPQPAREPASPQVPAPEASDRAPRFSYSVPDGWSTRELPGFRYEIVVGAPYDSFAPNVNFVDERYDGSFDDYVSNSLRLMAAEFGPTYRELARGPLVLDDGTVATRVSFERSTTNDRRLAQVTYFIDTAPRRFVLTCSRLASDQRPIDAICDSLVRTFRIVDPGT